MACSNDPPNDYVFRDHTNLLKANGSAQEQTFIENLIVESIEIYVQEILNLLNNNLINGCANTEFVDAPMPSTTCSFPPDVITILVFLACNLSILFEVSFSTDF